MVHRLRPRLLDDFQLVVAPAGRLDGLLLPEVARTFLTEAGLPRSCAPFLCFEEVGEGLPRLWEVFAPGQWQANEKAGLEHYLMIGSDGGGNPFCVDDRDGKVVMLDHELLFDLKRRGERVVSVNSGISELAESLLLYQHSEGGSHRSSIGLVDPPAVETGAFWSAEEPG